MARNSLIRNLVNCSRLERREIIFKWFQVTFDTMRGHIESKNSYFFLKDTLHALLWRFVCSPTKGKHTLNTMSSTTSAKTSLYFECDERVHRGKIQMFHFHMKCTRGRNMDCNFLLLVNCQ